jgi:hypothetical protein
MCAVEGSGFAHDEKEEKFALNVAFMLHVL